MTSVLDGVMDRITTGFSGMSWDGTITLAPKSPQTTEEQKRFAMSPGLRFGGSPAADRAAPERPRLPPARAEALRGAGAGGSERLWIVASRTTTAAG